jgi:hypothetical protein
VRRLDQRPARQDEEEAGQKREEGRDAGTGDAGQRQRSAPNSIVQPPTKPTKATT